MKTKKVTRPAKGRRTRNQPQLSHIDEKGRARMVDVSDKPRTVREAVARGDVRMSEATLRLLTGGRLPKGDVLSVARLAGIMAAKRTADLIPLCHPLQPTGIEVELTPDLRGRRVRIESRIRLNDRTGAEMEALVAVSIAALTIYDMCKAVDRGMVIDRVRLVLKSGGRSGTYTRSGESA